MSLKALLPMIRRVFPGTIAQELISVQPMTASAGNVFSVRHNYATGLPIGLTMENVSEMIARLRATGFDEDAEVIEQLVAIWKYNTRHYTSDPGPM